MELINCIYILPKAVRQHFDPYFRGLERAVWLILLISPQSLIAILPVLCGVILILNSAMQMQKSFTLRSHGYDNWIYAFIISLVILIGGIILLLRPIQTMKFILQLVGICLIVEGVIILVNQHEINKYLD